MELSLIEIISLLIVFVSLLLATFLFTMKAGNYKSNLLLALFLVVSAQDSDSIFIAQFVYPSYPAAGLFINSTLMLKLPLFYLYILSVIYFDFKLNWRHLLHAVPFLLINIILIPGFYSRDFAGQMEYVNYSSLSDRPFEIQLSYILFHIQIAGYFIASFLAVIKYRKLLLENFSNANLFHYKWLFQFIMIFGFLALVASLKNLFMFIKAEEAYNYSVVITSFIALAYIIWMVLRAMRHPEFFRGIDSKLQLVKSMIKESDTYKVVAGEDNNLSEEAAEKAVLLNDHMATSEPYLDPSLSIYELAKQINIPVKDLSLLINHDLNQHFFDFVNGYRIKKAMQILRDPGRKEFTVLEILYEVGFNSKSSFNTAFKKYTQITPTEYRKKYLQSAA